MVKLTLDVIEDARQFVNAVQDRELDLRGFKIPVLENLGATYNQFDTIDFTDNDIKRLENFPLLPRLKCLLLNNNRINYIDGDLSETIPNLNTLVLTNNSIEELGDLDPLAKFPKLEHLCLMGNPVTKKPQYRLYVIWKVPKVRVIDFRRIKLKVILKAEREAAKALFKGKKGETRLNELGKRSNTFNPGELAGSANGESSSAPVGRAQEDVDKIKKAIGEAKSLQEVERLQELLESGQIPGSDSGAKAKMARIENMDAEEEEEEEEEEETETNGESDKVVNPNGTSEEPEPMAT